MQINHEKQHKKKKNLLRKYRKSWFAFLIAGLLFSLSRVKIVFVKSKHLGKIPKLLGKIPKQVPFSKKTFHDNQVIERC
jgi:hypothetical protein